VSGSEDKDDPIKIAILLNFAGEDAIEVFKTFEFSAGDDKKLDKVIEQFERYCNPRKNVVFERYQFWKITQRDSETVDQFVTRLKNKVKSFEYTSVDDMVRDKFVFSIQDLTVKERLLREEKLTLEKASISMARAAEASKEQIKVMNARAQSSEANQSVNVLRYGANQGKEQIGSLRENQSPKSVDFVVWFTH
jgi:Arc/MetJ-type ribon-helix-helix transcriptional regulator